MLFTKRNTNALAVDLSLDAVRLVSIRRTRGQIQIEDLATHTLPEGPVNTLPERHLSVLAEMLSSLRLRATRIVAALPNNLIITRALRLETEHRQSIEERIVGALQNCIPFNPQDLVFDHWPVGEPNAKGQEIIVVATQASIVNQYLQGFEQLKLQCVHLDVAPCAVSSLIAHSVHGTGPVCALVVNGNQGYFAISENSKILFWRPFDLNVATEQAAELNPKTLERMAEEISRCFTHIASNMPLDKISEMMLFGRWSADPTLSGYLADHFHVPTNNPSPLDALGPTGLSPVARQTADSATATQYATAVGLALQYSGGLLHG